MSSELPASGQRVLVVDDEADIANLLALRLHGADCTVRTANSAQEAMALLDGEPADLAFLDVSMPGMTGLELLDWIRERQLDMAVVLMTAFGSEEVAVDALRRGADDYLRKPFSMAELGAVLQRTLDALRMRRENARLRQELAERAALMELQSLTDALTGLANRRAFDRELARLAALAERGGHHFCALMADIDHFKLVNDQHGHAVGDAVLQAISAALQSRVRSTDVLARVGGEEFALLLPNTELAGGSQVAEELRAAVEELAIASPAGPLRVTISLGVAHSSAPEPPLQAADAALYEAKNGGRNRVVTHQPEADPPAG